MRLEPIRGISFAVATLAVSTAVVLAATKQDTVLPGQRHTGLAIKGPYVTATVGCVAAQMGRYCTHSQLLKPGTNSVAYDLGPGSTAVAAGTYDHYGVGSGAAPAGAFPTSSINY